METREESVPAPGAPNSPLHLNSALQMAVAYCVVFVIMAFIQFAGPAIVDNDGYYHIRSSRMLRESVPSLPSARPLPLTILEDHEYANHHFLFHVMLIPFTGGDLRIGAKWAAVVFGSLGVTSLFSLLVAFRVPFRWLWLAPLVASSDAFLYRLSMTRAQSVSLAFLSIGCFLILRRKLRLLALLSFGFVWLYSLFPLIVVLSLIYTIVVMVVERRFDGGPLTATVAGVAAGIVLNPYFPSNLWLFLEHVRMKAVGFPIRVGIEWYPYDTWTLAGAGSLALAALLLSLAALNPRALDPRGFFFVLVSVFFLLLVFRSRRFIEYWPGFAILAAAFTSARWIEAPRTGMSRRGPARVLTWTAASVAIAAVLAVSINNVFRARAFIASEPDPVAYSGAGQWLSRNSSPGEIVFNTDWDDFPMLFHHSPRNGYVAGLDPTYLHARDPKLWSLYERITLGLERDAAPLIRSHFGAEIVFTDNRHVDFLRAAAASGKFETVYEDPYSKVLRIRGE